MKYTFFVILTTFFLFSTVQAENFLPAENQLNTSICGEIPTTTYMPVLSAGGSFSFNVTAPSNCIYSISSNAPAWLVLNSPTTATGNSIVNFTVIANQQLFIPRASVIVVGGKTFTVNQARASGPYAKRPALDFNGDDVSDFTAIQNNNGNMTWWSYRNHIVTGGSTGAVTFGLFATDVPVPNDFDGDLKADTAIWRGGASTGDSAYFYVFQSQTNTVNTVPFGLFGDNPTITQDFDGDFKADHAVTRKQNGKLFWYVLLSATNRIHIQQFGNETDRPIRGDYDGDFRADLAVYRPNTDVPANTFFVLKSSDEIAIAVNFGLSDIDKIVPGDYDGDNKTDFAVWRTTTGVWYWINSSSGQVGAYQFGLSSDLPVPGDYNDDNRSDFAVWRPNANQGIFYIQVSGGTSFISFVPWGNSAMKIPANSMQVQ